jgi:hypothetical protein
MQAVNVRTDRLECGNTLRFGPAATCHDRNALNARDLIKSLASAFGSGFMSPQH